jgi:hypothetical protein
VLQPSQSSRKSSEPEVQFQRSGDSTTATITIGKRIDRLDLGKSVTYTRGDEIPVSINLNE